jgi:hypothetical protein
MSVVGPRPAQTELEDVFEIPEPKWRQRWAENGVIRGIIDPYTRRKLFSHLYI